MSDQESPHFRAGGDIFEGLLWSECDQEVGRSELEGPTTRMRPTTCTAA